MDQVLVNNRIFEPYITADSIDARLNELAHQINEAYADKNPIFLVVLNGAFMFASDLLKKITIPCAISFVKLASYEGTSSTGKVKTLIGLSEDLDNRHIVVMEDIVDTGKTMMDIYRQMESRHVASIRITSLLLKTDALVYPIEVDFAAFEVPNYFYLGYGLDFDGYGRNLPFIYKLKEGN